MSSTRPILEARDLRVRITAPGRTVDAVRGITFDLAPGEALAVVGESGCGKTTALRAVAGLLPGRAKATGSVRFDGLEVLDAPESARRRVRGRGIAMIFQDPMTALDPVIRVGDQIAEGPRQVLGLSGRESRARAIDLLRSVGVPDPEQRALAYPHELSGGLRQRVMIATALALEPRVLLCDEPTTALDVTIQDQILALLTRIRAERGVALIYVTHDLAVVAQTCERLAVMYAGELVETGAVAEVFSNPRHPYTRGLLASVPDFDAGRARLPQPIPGSPPDLAAPPPGCAFHPRCPWADEACVRGAFPLRDLAPGRATACIHADRLPVEAVA
jgi:peptide/nickel transport system ATP-binding protein/oligopeptide transport system ATP-binding protein